jgi:hypothetical protein
VKLETKIGLLCATSEVQLWGGYALALGCYSKLQQRSLCLHRSERFGDRRFDQRVGNGRMLVACRSSRGELWQRQRRTGSGQLYIRTRSIFECGLCCESMYEQGRAAVIRAPLVPKAAGSKHPSRARASDNPQRRATTRAPVTPVIGSAQLHDSHTSHKRHGISPLAAAGTRGVGSRATLE